MKNVKMPTNDNWQDALIESLENPERAAGYIEAVLSEKEPEPELLQSALKDVIDARRQSDNLSEKTRQHYEKLDKMLSETGGSEIYSLIEFLDALGFRMPMPQRGLPVRARAQRLVDDEVVRVRSYLVDLSR